MSIALHLPCRLLTPELSPTQVVLAHLPHRCSPSSGDHLPLLFVTGYSRMSFGIFQGKIKSIFDFNKIVALIGTNFYNAVGWVSTENPSCQDGFCVNASNSSKSSRILEINCPACIDSYALPLTRKSMDTSKASDNSSSKSMEIPRLPNSIFPRCTVLIFTTAANCSCVNPRSFRISFRRQPNAT